MPQTKYTPENWETMTRAEKRIEIAKDVIAQLEAEWLKAKCGVFVGDSADGWEHLNKPFAEITEELEPCEVCGLGALFVTHVQFVDGTTLKQVLSLHGCGMRDILQDIFPREQLYDIEAAFERIIHMFGKGRGKAKAFGSRYGSAKRRLIAIMRNIIRNKGTFKP